MELVFKILAVILAGIAAYFLWRKNADGAFVAAVLGAVSFFLSVRFQVKGRLKQREIEAEEIRRKREEDMEPSLLSDDFDSITSVENEYQATNEEQKANL